MVWVDTRIVERYLPKPLRRVLGRSIVSLAVHLGRNRLKICGEYPLGELVFTNYYEFVVCLKLASDELPEGFDLSLFDLPPGHDAAIDVGAHHGMYSILLGKLNPDLPLYVFEPNDQNRGVLTRFLRSNGVEAEIRDDVVTGEDGQVAFFERRAPGSESHSTTPPAAGATEPSMRRGLALTTLFQEEGLTRPFLKIDAEGEEEHIVEDLLRFDRFGGIRAIVEMHPDKMETSVEDLVDSMERAGWTVESLGDTTGPGWTPRPALLVRYEDS